MQLLLDWIQGHNCENIMLDRKLSQLTVISMRQDRLIVAKDRLQNQPPIIC